MSSIIKFANMEDERGATKTCVKCCVKPQGENWKKMCKDCANEPCEMCGEIKFLHNHEATGKKLCFNCRLLENMKIACSKCGKTDKLGYGFSNTDEDGVGCCIECFKAHVAKPCYRCGEPGEEQNGYWECYNCAHTWWCTECDEAKSVYFDGPDSGFNSGFCLECLLKKELDSAKCECCGSEGKYYNKDKNEWLCSSCVYYDCMGR